MHFAQFWAGGFLTAVMGIVLLVQLICILFGASITFQALLICLVLFMGGSILLASGILGESFVRFEAEIGLRRLKEYGLKVKFMPHALKGMEYVKAHPEKRAEDLLEAFQDPSLRDGEGQ